MSTFIERLSDLYDEIPQVPYDQYVSTGDPILNTLKNTKAMAKNAYAIPANVLALAGNVPGVVWGAASNRTLDQANQDLMAVGAAGKLGAVPARMMGATVAKNAASGAAKPIGGPAAQRGAIGDLSKVDTSYRISHTAPTREGKNAIYDMSDVYPEDIYDPKVSGRYYGHGDQRLDNKSAQIIAGLKGKPDAEVIIYRAVPKGVKDINPGDWVTINKDYASQHGSSWVDDGSYDIISKKVKASDIHTDANSIHEFGYNPSSNSDIPQLPDEYELLD